MQRTHSQPAVVVGAFVVLLGLISACGSGSSKAGNAGATRSTVDTGGATAAQGDSGSSGGAAGSSCVKDGDRLSGSSTVMWTADSKSKYEGSEATPKTTMLLGANGVLAPSTLTVKIGEVFTFGLADGNKNIASIIVGCSGAQIVYTGPALAAEYITAPGTYSIVNEFDDKKLGTVTVE